MSAFALMVSVPIGIVSSAVGLKVSEITVLIKKLNRINSLEKDKKAWWNSIVGKNQVKHNRSLNLSQQTFVLVKTYWRCLEDVLKTFWEDVLQIRLEDVFKTTSRGLGRQKVLRWRRLQDVLKTSWKTRNVWWGKAFVDSNINDDDFVLMRDLMKEYNAMKEAVKKTKIINPYL